MLQMRPQNILQDDEEMDLEYKAIERIKLASNMSLKYYGAPLVCTYSGGKDSDVMLELFKRSGVPFEVFNSHTTADAPQTVRHIRKVFANLSLQGLKCEIDYHVQPDGSRLTMWNLIPRKMMPPTRMVRYCCKDLKEGGCSNRYIATGVRWAESTKRQGRKEFEKIGSSIKTKDFFTSVMLMNDNNAKRRMTEYCMQKKKMVVNPIIDWEDSDIWDYINSERIDTDILYKCGYDRIGCIGCPLTCRKQREKEMHDFPKFKQAYIRAFDRMLEERKRRGKDTKWTCGEEVYHWWMEDPNIEGQRNLFEDYPELISE